MKSILQPSRNCQLIAKARRAAWLIDGQAYFGALHQALCRARRTIFIVGWDLHSEVRLVREKDTGGYPSTLGKLLETLARERPQLQIFLLSWDFAMIYAMEREFFPRYRLKWRTRDNIHFILDGHHPVGASQHQKVVVIDDALAFAGGMDLSQWRWDTPQHLPEDQRRVDPGGRPYPPFHDVQLAVDGPAAAALGKLVRERWERAAESPPKCSAAKRSADPWPPDLEPDLHDTEIAIARTLPAHGRQRAVEEVRRLYRDSIAAARSWIYIENQYLSAHCIGEALAARLAEDDGPEVVIVLPQQTGGWLEQHTMDVLRGRLLKRLQEADSHDRLRVYFPQLASESEHSLMVHAKVMVVDDGFMRVGSSNLSNRSMGLDSECDLAIAAGPEDEERQKTIARFRNRLLAEHLGCQTEEVDQAMQAQASLISVIEGLQGGGRTLAPLESSIPPEVDKWVPESELLDPEQPVPPEKLLDLFVSPEEQPSAFRQNLKIVVLVAAVLSLAALWRWTPLGEVIDFESARRLAVWIQQRPLAPFWVVAVYTAGSALAIPVTLMVIATVLVFGTWLGLAYALAGACVSAAALFAVGRWMGRDAVRRLAGGLLNRISRKLADNGLLTVITFRIVPVAPFAVINLIAGVSAIRWRDFALGTLIGLLPGVTAIALLADRAAASLRQPDIGQFSLLLTAVLLVGLGLFGLRRWIKRRRAAQGS
ncbi:MAG: VTT domain-containing protein [Desulfobacterales bacterium]